jgi:tRNA uridine 5-carboxymethylaminomethyl modification enzyme
LTPIGIELGLVGHQRAEKFSAYSQELDQGRQLLQSLEVTPNEAARYGIKLNQDGTRRSAYELLAYPEQSLDVLRPLWPELSGIKRKTAEALETEALYAVYMKRQSADIQATQRDQARIIPADFEFTDLPGLSNELKVKLTEARPANLAQAANVDGMTPAALALLLALIRKDSLSVERVKRVS